MRLFIQSMAQCKRLACSERSLLRKTDPVQCMVGGSSVYWGRSVPSNYTDRGRSLGELRLGTDQDWMSGWNFSLRVD